MPRPFQHLAKELTEVVDEFVQCRDKQRRRELLVRIRLILSEVDQFEDPKRRVPAGTK